MKFSRVCGWWRLTFMALILSCGSCDGESSDNDDSESDDSSVSFPDLTSDSQVGPGGGLKVVAIAQDESALGGNFYGMVDEAGELSLTGFEADTEETTFQAEVDAELQIERVDINDTGIDFSYDETTFDFSVQRGDAVLYSGFNVPRPTAADDELADRQIRVVQPVDVQDCRDALIATVATRAEQKLSGADTATADANFISCLQDMPEIRRMAATVCATKLLLVPALEKQLARCPDQPHPAVCTARTAPALQAAKFFRRQLVRLTLEVIQQIRLTGEICTVSASLAENLLINGSFEEGPDSSLFQSLAGQTTPDYLPLDPGDMSLPGWVVTRAQIDIVEQGYTPADGIRCVDLNGTPGAGGVAQTFSTVVGQQYLVSFALSGNAQTSPATKQIGVEVAGLSLEFSTDPLAANPIVEYVTHAFSFTALAKETTLEIYSLDDPSFTGPVVDDVMVIPIPESAPE
ncbi:MAG: hypothetical protein HJJLKODD_00763 [Phycisphaerae bacterium]|nr:hypothetical protein [Phycisphaerae bacterium]